MNKQIHTYNPCSVCGKEVSDIKVYGGGLYCEEHLPKDNINHVSELVDYPTKEERQELKKLFKDYVAKQTKQKWLMREVEKLSWANIRHIEDNEETEQSVSIYINEKKDFIIYDLLSDTIDLPRVEFLSFYRIKKICKLIEKYKEME